MKLGLYGYKKDKYDYGFVIATSLKDAKNYFKGLAPISLVNKRGAVKVVCFDDRKKFAIKDIDNSYVILNYLCEMSESAKQAYIDLECIDIQAEIDKYNTIDCEKDALFAFFPSTGYERLFS